MTDIMMVAGGFAVGFGLAGCLLVCLGWWRSNGSIGTDVRGGGVRKFQFRRFDEPQRPISITQTCVNSAGSWGYTPLD